MSKDNTMKSDRRAEQAIQMILDACAAKGYPGPYDVLVTDARGTRIAARFDHDTSKPLAGDLGSIGVISPPLKVSVTDAKGECAEFAVELLDRDDGTRIMPIIGYPPEWIKATPDPRGGN